MKESPINPHNYVGPPRDPQTIGIIGGEGEMGTMLAREFREDGFRVRVTGYKAARLAARDPKNPQEVARALRRINEAVVQEAEVIIFAVPINSLSAGMRKILGNRGCKGMRGKLILDISSTKEEPLNALGTLRGPSIVGMHPMFGPRVSFLRGQNVVLCPMLQPSAQGQAVMRKRLDYWVIWIREFWEKRGVKVLFRSAAGHDRSVPCVQFLVLCAALCYCRAIQTTHTDPENLIEMRTPNSRLLGAIMGRMLSSSMMGTYLNLTFENKSNIGAANAFEEAAATIADILRNDKRKALEEMLGDSSRFIAGEVGNVLRDEAKVIQELLANVER